jgi:hypothetical protein
MGWSIGYDSRWKRDIGYGVPALCDHPDCTEEIDRGLACVCGGEPYGGDRGCGLYFCEKHHSGSVSRGRETIASGLCTRCYPRIKSPFAAKADVRAWVEHKLKDPSWARWRKESPKEVAQLRARMRELEAA